MKEKAWMLHSSKTCYLIKFFWNGKKKVFCKNLLNPFCVFSFVIWRPKLWWFLELVSIQDRAWLWGLAAVYLSSVAPGVHHHSAGNKCIPQISVYLERHHGNANFLPQAAERERERNQCGEAQARGRRKERQDVAVWWGLLILLCLDFDYIPSAICQMACMANLRVSSEALNWISVYSVIA